MKLGGRHPPLSPDPELIRRLAELLTETGLTEIEYALGDQRLRVVRNLPGTVVAATTAAVAGAAVAAPPAAGEMPPAAHPGTVRAPMVGIAYMSPQPGAPPFVRIGDTVSEGDTLLVIEAMKVMNQIRAPRAGRVIQIFVEDETPVEYGAPLLAIE